LPSLRSLQRFTNSCATFMAWMCHQKPTKSEENPKVWRMVLMYENVWKNPSKNEVLNVLNSNMVF
jgi:hypothetical protein